MREAMERLTVFMKTTQTPAFWKAVSAPLGRESINTDCVYARRIAALVRAGTTFIFASVDWDQTRGVRLTSRQTNFWTVEAQWRTYLESVVDAAPHALRPPHTDADVDAEIRQHRRDRAEWLHRWSVLFWIQMRMGLFDFYTPTFLKVFPSNPTAAVGREEASMVLDLMGKTMTLEEYCADREIPPR